MSNNETATNEICNYAVAAGLHIIVFFGDIRNKTWQMTFLDTAKQKWNDRFLGIYYYDEPGGIMLDYNWTGYFEPMKQRNPTLYQRLAPGIDGNVNGSLTQSYDEAARSYVNSLKNYTGLRALKTRGITTFTSDYALYWFDYLAGYDVILAQFGAFE